MDELYEKINALTEELEQEKEKSRLFQEEAYGHRVAADESANRLNRVEDELMKYREIIDNVDAPKERLHTASPFVFEDLKKYQHEVQKLNQALEEQYIVNEELKATVSKLKKRKKPNKNTTDNKYNDEKVEMIYSKPNNGKVEMIYSKHNNEKVDQLDREEQLDQVDQDGSNQHDLTNGWTNETDTMLLNWKLSVSKNIFIYGIIFDKYKTRLENFLIYSLISSGMGTLLAGISTLVLGLSEEDTVLIWIGFGVSILILITDLLGTIFTGIMTIKKYPEFTTKLSGYMQKLNGFYSIVSSQYRMPFRLRSDGDTFIKSENESYVDLLRDAPLIGHEDYEEGDDKFDEFSNKYV